MRRSRVFLGGSAGGLLAGALVATVWGQAPVPPTGPAPRIVCEPAGRPLRNMTHHAWHVLQRKVIGYPQEFTEPPVGFYINEAFAIQRNKANIHRFTLYKTDFLDGTNQLSPVGATRLNTMMTRLNGWLGPITIEWSPDQPNLAESRKTAIVGLLQAQGLPVIPERVVIGPSPYPGSLGAESGAQYGIMINRNQSATASYSLTPTSSGGFSSSGSGGGGTP